MRAPSAREQRTAAAYDGDIWPLLPGRSAELILRALPKLSRAVVFEAGCGTGALALALAERLDEASRVMAIDPSPPLVELAQQRAAKHAAGARVSFQVAELGPPFPVEDRSYDLGVANLSLADLPTPRAAVDALAATLKPAGQAIVTFPLRGSWVEFLDIYREVLGEQGKREALAALDAYEAALPDANTAAAWLEAAGLESVTVETVRWEILFKSAREFFFSPVIELGPLLRWKLIAGGRGDEMQDIFFFVKEAIESYFAGGVFPLTVVVGCLTGTKSKSRRR